MQAGGTTIRNINISNAQSGIEDSFFDSPSYYQVDTYTPSTPLSSTPLDCWIVDDSDTVDQKKITAYPGQNLDRGYLVYWKGSYWLTVWADVNFGDIYSRGVIQKCNAVLKFIAGQTETITGTDSLGRPIKNITPTYRNIQSVARAVNRLTIPQDLEVNVPDGRVVFSIQNDSSLNIDIATEFEVYNQTWKVISLDLTNTKNNVGGVFTFTAERRQESS